MSYKLNLVLAGTFLFIVSFSAAGNVQADWVIDSSGTLVKVADIAALYGETGSVAEVSESNKTSKLPVDAKDEPIRVRVPLGSPTPTPSPYLEPTSSDNPVTNQARNKFNQEVSARTKNQEKREEHRISKLSIEDEGLLVTQNVINNHGQLVKEEKVTIPQQEALHIEKKNGELLEIKVEDEDTLVIHDGSEPTRTRTNFPLGIDEDGTLTITHKDGTSKEVTVLPEAALKNLETKGFVPTSEVELTLDEDKPVYKSLAQKLNRHFLGIKHPAFEVKLDRFEVKISGQNGTVAESRGSLSAWQRILDRLSF